MHRDDPEESSKLFWEIEILSVAMTGIVTVAWLVWIFISTQYSAYYGILTLTVIAVAFDISWYFAGFELFKYIVIRNTIVKLTGIALLFILVKTKNDVAIYIAIMAATGLLGNISMWTYLPKFLKKVDIRRLRPFRHFKQTFAYFIPTIATSVYTVLDKTMIGVITKSSDQNGYYEQATKIVRMIQSLLFSLNTVMTSRQSYLFAEKKYDEIKDKINKSFDYLFGIAIAAMFGLQGIAANFVPWFFGKGYDSVAPLLYVMALLPFVICISNVLGNQYLTPSGQSIGAAVASVIAEAVISVIYMHMSKGYASWGYLIRISWKKFIAGIVMLGIVVFIGRGRSGSIVTTLIQILGGGLVYISILSVLKDSFIESVIHLLKEKIHG